MRQEDLRDVSGLGGLPLFVMTALGAQVTGRGGFAVLLVAGFAVGYAMTVVLRLAYFRPRPEPQEYNSALERFDANSFPSVHVMRGTLFWVLVAEQVGHPLFSAACALAVLLIAWSRVCLRRHHATDVVVGVLVGLSAALVAQFLWTGNVSASTP